MPEPTIAQRIVRAKRTLTAARVPFEVPQGDALHERLAAVLEVIYLIFNEGYAATAGEDWMRPALCEEALRLGRVLAALAPNEAEVQGLVALMEIQASRLRAAHGRGRAADPAAGSGPGALGSRAHRSRAGGPRACPRDADALGAERGPYALQAAIAACHARARTAAETDWRHIVALYDALALRVPSPVVELNRAVAVGMAFGAAAALPLVDALAQEPTLQRYHLMHAVRADLLEKLGRVGEAREALRHAAELTQNERERELLLARARGLVH